MEYLVCYDISDDRRRTQAANVLLDFGRRVQESVFMADIDEDLAGRMRERLEKVIDPNVDSVVILTLCGTCRTKAKTMGIADIPEDKEFYII